MAFTDSIEHAARFLTRPLILAIAPVRVAALQVILRSTLQAACSGTPLVLPFAPNRVPPRPVFAAAIGAGVSWADWMSLLAPREFALVITPRAVRAEYAGLRPHTVVVWADLSAPAAPAAAPAPQPEQVPISKLGQRLHATVASARERAQTRTRAQQLLDATHESDAAELFARLARSHAGLLSPSPTRAAFAPAPAAPRALFAGFPSPLSAPRSTSPTESASSRPSSRSSMFSAGADSESSASSVAECDAPEAKPTAPSLPRVFVAPRRAPVFVPEPAPTKVVVDANKKDITKYLYQGGVSTVLTGGVMLGAAPAARAAPAPATTPRYRAPHHTKNASATAGTWRRAAARA
ncbi:hypothetical protein HYPSUDRAFT_40943 [Hypholoma sublateritium FD-334 SS-4]|uniref:Uncharacterized protein n=1 Tax=Hypholoma sublateritium (strain FD-334 SS-4) TaxID=945553 RepID=A0A0D2P1G0_HYPSF|nr:hypothetical protein HYPSUDRAFT_40943 [Hypholoma sublateritium FD-334 SS-4]